MHTKTTTTEPMQPMMNTSIITTSASPLPLPTANAVKSIVTISSHLSGRRNLISTTATLLATSLSLTLVPPLPALAESWGTRSFILERYFQPGLSPEDSVARIRQTQQGLHSMRHMLDTMAWRYVIFYIRLKQSYLSQDLRSAIYTLPQGLRKEYVDKANELVDNMYELDSYVRTPKVYESYLYYERTLKSIDELVAMLA